MKPIHELSITEWLMQNIGSTYTDISQAQSNIIALIVAEFYKSPDFFPIDKVTNLLSPYFKHEKAEQIAITEKTRVWSYSLQINGEYYQEKYPDGKVIKTWCIYDFSDCDMCKSLEGKEVEISEPFVEGVLIPPAHQGCTCWIELHSSNF
jgi:hypothetical protein